ncbi:hypothetical protein [Brevibacillus sp. SYSU BS000544]|uniref:hypothetical protein n=1 Tax=Brevibacillus sp. SYSU BS000544 TaxID=3416443 RepID=UPI003CE507D0
MQKYRFLTLLLIFSVIGLLLAGCGDKRAAKDVMVDAFKKQATLNSYSFQGTMKFQVDADQALLDSDPNAAAFIDALKKSQLTYHGSTSVEPFQTELVLDAKVEFQGMSMNFNMPILFNQDKLWVKVPAIDLFPELAQLKGKFVEVDFKQLSEMSGQPVTFSQNMKAQREVGQKAVDIFFKHVGNEYFADVAKDAFPLPEGITEGRVVKFQMTNDNFAPLVKKLLGSVIPEVLDVIATSELGKDMKKEDLDQTKADVQEALKEFEASGDEWKKSVNIKKGDIIFIIDKENNVPYQMFDVSLQITPPEEKGSFTLGVTFDQKLTNIGQTPKWEITTPKPEEIVPLSDLMGGANF